MQWLRAISKMRKSRKWHSNQTATVSIMKLEAMEIHLDRLCALIMVTRHANARIIVA